MDLDGVRCYTPDTAASGDREAAVIVPVIERASGVHLLFTKRAEDLSDHPGQMSFPGGQREPEDESLQATAHREGREEVCLDPDQIEHVGRLDDIETVTRYSVRPFVARVPDRQYIPCENEVAEIAILGVSELTDLDNYHGEQRDHPYYGEIRLHYFYVDGYTVWGATARILAQLLELTTDWRAPRDLEQVEPDADFPV